MNVIQTKNLNSNTRNTDKITLFRIKYNFFKKNFFPSTVVESNELDRHLRNTASLSVFKTNLLKFIRQSGNSVFNCHNSKEIKYLTRLRLGIIHLRQHKFKHKFKHSNNIQSILNSKIQDTLNPFCSCGLDVDTNTHFFLYCPLFTNVRRTLLRAVNE